MTTTFSGAALRYGIFGGSHEPCIGVEAEGLPAGEAVDLDELSAFLRRRAPGQNAWSTPRKEADAPEFTSGLDESGRLTGGILRAVIYNTNTRSGDYALDVPRPSHADYPAHVKYGGAVNMAVESDAGTLAKVSVSADDGRELECSGGAVLPERLVRKFVLRDLRVALGLGGFEGAAVVVRRLERGKTASISADGYTMEFSEYGKIGAECVPTKTEISNDNYRLKLELVGEIKRR